MVSEAQSLVRCSSCGLLFNDRRRIDLDHLYSDAYFVRNEKAAAGGGFFNYALLEKAVARMYGDSRRFLRQQVRRQGAMRVLDVGCSYGFFLKALRKEGLFQVQGVEMMPQAVAYATSQGIDVWKGSFEDFPGKDTFDAITFFEVFEHVLDPDAIFRKARVLLKNGGFAMIATPDAGGIWFRLLGRRWPGVHADVHNVYFSEATVRRFASRHGFRVVKIRRSHLLWSDGFHLRKRLTELFPELRFFLGAFRFFDPFIFPFPNGGDLRIILQKMDTGTALTRPQEFPTL